MVIWLLYVFIYQVAQEKYSLLIWYKKNLKKPYTVSVGIAFSNFQLDSWYILCAL